MTDPAPSATRLTGAFPAAPDPAAYVPRLAAEAALAELGEVIGKTPACAALSGEAGLGKTLLLKVLRERMLGAFECLYVPFPRLSPDELWRWAAVALGLGSGDDDRGAVLGRARRLRGGAQPASHLQVSRCGHAAQRASTSANYREIRMPQL